jgi:hypothetical protein
MRENTEGKESAESELWGCTRSRHMEKEGHKGDQEGLSHNAVHLFWFRGIETFRFILHQSEGPSGLTKRLFCDLKTIVYKSTLKFKCNVKSPQIPKSI